MNSITGMNGDAPSLISSVSAPIHLNVLDVARAAAKAYREGRLSAQSENSACQYRDRNGNPCVIGAAVDDATAARWDDAPDCKVEWLHGAGYFATDDIDALVDLQCAHDDWSSGIDRTAERRLVSFLNAVLPDAERIETSPSTEGRRANTILPEEERLS